MSDTCGEERTASYWIKRLDLRPHPEGGWFREVYRSSDTIPSCGLPHRFPASSERATATSLYYLLESGQISAFHRIRSDEIWHHYDGSTILLHTLSSIGEHAVARVGHEPDAQLQVVVPSTCWFAAEVEQSSGWALLGCTVAPGFSFDDFELAARADLLKQFPHRSGLIARLAHTLSQNLTEDTQ